MIIGAHSVIYSTDPEADHSFLRDVLKLPAVDGGGRTSTQGERLNYIRETNTLLRV
jgi:hypothetical protein